MYKHDARQMLLPHEFFLLFAGQLNPENRWCKLAAMISWAAVEERYIKRLGNLRAGQKAYSVRLALGTLIIQNHKNLSDRETVAEITEIPYLQYFIGLPGFVQEPPFDPSLLVHFRKQLGKDTINDLNELMILVEEKQDHPDDPEPPTDASNSDFSRESSECNTETNKGHLILDATCVPVDIQYPTDSRLLNESREAIEEIIDVLHAPHIGKCLKPRTYRQKARKEHLRFERKRIHTRKEIRKFVGKQLSYVGRDLKITAELVQKSSLTLLDGHQYKNLLIVNELHRQQLQMFKNRKHSTEDRIVSLHMPFVRPIVRGKSNAW